jgi:glutamate-1-semialdehyde 2,1-aminomutase
LSVPDSRIRSSSSGTWAWLPASCAADDFPQAVYMQGRHKGAAKFSGLEGGTFSKGSCYFTASDGGPAGQGQVWRYTPDNGNFKRGTLELLVASPRGRVLNNPDAIALSPRGGLILCEDGESEDIDGRKAFIRGLKPNGELFDFAQVTQKMPLHDGFGMSLFPEVDRRRWDRPPRRGAIGASEAAGVGFSPRRQVDALSPAVPGGDLRGHRAVGEGLVLSPVTRAGDGIRETDGVAEISRELIASLMKRERERFVAEHPRSRELHDRARESLLSGVPMNWMTRWPGDFPVFMESARGAELSDVDGNVYADLCLGDTGAMTGHAPEATIAAVNERLERGITAMLPTEDALAVGEEMHRRFGLPEWQFTLSATDANRFVVRICRQITGRPKVMVHNHCYHGSVDETVATLVDGRVEPRAGSVGPGVPVGETTRVVEINDLEALERELAEGDVACLLIEPALTNIGIVLADPGYHERVRELTRATGTLLVIDETHTLCCGPGGFTRAHGLEPDFLTIGKPIGGGIPTGAYGFTAEVAQRIVDNTFWHEADVGGVGGTLAGNALSLAAVRATLSDVLTEEAFGRMIALAERFEDGVAAAIAERGLPWSITRLGCRAEYMFAPTPPRNGAEAAAAMDEDLDALLHLYMLNRGVLVTPFHMMALMSPATTAAQVDRHRAAFEEAAAELTGA